MFKQSPVALMMLRGYSSSATLMPNAGTMSSEIISLEHPLSMTIWRSTPLPPNSLLHPLPCRVAVSISSSVHPLASKALKILWPNFSVSYFIIWFICLGPGPGSFIFCLTLSAAGFFYLSSFFFFCLYCFSFSFFFAFFAASVSWVSPISLVSLHLKDL